MTNKTTNKFSPEVRARAVQMVLDHGAEYPSQWAVVYSISAKIGCSAYRLNEWIKCLPRWRKTDGNCYICLAI